MPDLFDEIKEDVQQEKYEKLWKDVGKYVIGAAVSVVLITAGFVGYKSYTIKEYERQGNILFSAFSTEQKNDTQKAMDEYSDLADIGQASYAAIANMRRASLHNKEGKESQATEIYKDISENKKNPDEVRQLAEILYLQSAIEHDKEPSLLNRLQEIADGQGIFKYSAKEILGFSKYNSMEYSQAKVIFEELSNDIDTPTRMKMRSSEMLSAINAKNVGNNG